VKKKAKKDPNAPKKGLSSFMFFSKQSRATVLEENPVRARGSAQRTALIGTALAHAAAARVQGIAFGEVGKKLGEKWKALSAEDKVPFEQQAAADKERFLRDDKAYKASGGPAAFAAGAGGGAAGGGAGGGSDADMAGSDEE
jgi:hypothetical protein